MSVERWILDPARAQTNERAGIAVPSVIYMLDETLTKTAEAVPTTKLQHKGIGVFFVGSTAPAFRPAADCILRESAFHRPRDSRKCQLDLRDAKVHVRAGNLQQHALTCHH